MLAIAVVAVAGQAATGSASTTASKGAATYTVRRGDTLIGIARHLQVPAADLARANGITDQNRLLAGRVLKLPARGAASRTLAPAPKPAGALVLRGGVGTHVVARGETLSAIASRHRVSVADLAALNALRRADVIRIGQRLQVPGASWQCPVRGMQRGGFIDTWGAPRPGGRRHLGTDLFARRGTPVVASVSGVVEHVSGAVAGLAFYLHGDDGNTYYGAHLGSVTGRPRRVRAGEVLGTVGTSGNAERTPPHLHFEIKPGGGAPVNSFPTLREWCR